MPGRKRVAVARKCLTMGGPYHGGTRNMEWAHIYTCILYIDALAWPTSFHKKRKSIHDIMLITSDIEKTTCTHFRRVDIFKAAKCLDSNPLTTFAWPHERH